MIWGTTIFGNIHLKNMRKSIGIMKLQGVQGEHKKYLKFHHLDFNIQIISSGRDKY